ncbi:MAG: ADP-ribosylglycohydrolase family protein [Chloroflexi bacterium]|nr:ADP-ribosylglycohydrolase family protein [Chloroflexota bacterium]
MNNQLPFTNFESRIPGFICRAQGALFGVAIGDAMGAPVEGRSAAEIRAQFGRITGFVSDAAVGTDDTDFTLFNAYLLIQHGASITPDQVEAEWRDKLLAPNRAYRPGGFSDVISTRNLAAGLHAPHSGAFNQQMWSDGVAMAISPAGIIAAGKPELAARLATTLGGVSNGRDGIFAAQAVAAAISVAMIGASPDEMLRAALDAVPENSWTHRALERAARVAQNLPDDLDAALEKLSDELVVSWWHWADLVTEAAPLAFGAFLATRGDLRRAIPAGVMLGRDADTIGAIVGSLAGAYSGRDAIPNEWLARATVAPGKCIGFVAGMNIEQVAEQLVGQISNLPTITGQIGNLPHADETQ